MKTELLECLRSAQGESWCGSIQVYSDSTTSGQVILEKGKIAWATSPKQHETLGGLLWRLGYLTKSQLSLVRNVFKACGGRKKLGTILDECGFLSRAVLRRGLLLHTRSAIGSLNEVRSTKVEMVPGDLARDELFVFELDELLDPKLEDAYPKTMPTKNATWRFWTSAGEENRVLRGFYKLAQYVASGIYNREGSIVTAHVANSKTDPFEIGALAASLMEGADRAFEPTGFGEPHILLVEHSDGWLVSSWVGAGRDYIVAVMVEASGIPGLVRSTLKKSMPQLEKWLEDHNRPDQLRALVELLLKQGEIEKDAQQAIHVAIRDRVGQLNRNKAPKEVLLAYSEASELLKQNKTKESLITLSRAIDLEMGQRGEPVSIAS